MKFSWIFFTWCFNSLLYAQLQLYHLNEPFLHVSLNLKFFTRLTFVCFNIFVNCVEMWFRCLSLHNIFHKRHICTPPCSVRECVFRLLFWPSHRYFHVLFWHILINHSFDQIFFHMSHIHKLWVIHLWDLTSSWIE